jgi:hypothetical protein
MQPHGVRRVCRSDEHGGHDDRGRATADGGLDVLTAEEPQRCDSWWHSDVEQQPDHQSTALAEGGADIAREV